MALLTGRIIFVYRISEVRQKKNCMSYCLKNMQDYLGATVTNIDEDRVEIKRRMNSGLLLYSGLFEINSTVKRCKQLIQRQLSTTQTYLAYVLPLVRSICIKGNNDQDNDSIQFSSLLLVCCINSQKANYRCSTRENKIINVTK
jgi:hypothetical protein